MKEVPMTATFFPAAAAATALASSGVRTTKMPLRSAPGFDSCRGLLRSVTVSESSRQNLTPKLITCLFIHIP